MRKAESKARGALVLAMVIFGTIGLLRRQIGLPSGVIAMVRGFLGALALLMFVLIGKKQRRNWDIKAKLPWLALSGVCLGLNWALLFEAYQFTSVATATLCYYMAPVFVVLASPLVLGERLSAKKLGCCAFAVLGMVLVSGVGQASVKGVMLGLAAAALYACVVLMNKNLTDVPGLDRSMIQLFVAAVAMIPYNLLTGGFAPVAVEHMDVALLAVLGVVHTGVAYALYFGSMKALKAQTVAIFSYIDPLVAVACSAVILQEPLSPWGWVGAALILGSAVVSEL